MGFMDEVSRRLGLRSEEAAPAAGTTTRQASWRGTVLAESDRTVVVEGNHYFPLQSVRQQYLRHSGSHTVCAWKGTASYYDVVVDGEVSRDAAWYYPEPASAAERIRGHVAF